MYNQRPPFLPGGAPQQQYHLNPNIFPNPNNHFLLQQDPNFLPHSNPFFQYPSNFPQFHYQLPNNSFPIPSNPSASGNNNRKFLQQAKLQNETIDKLDKAVLKAQHDFLSSNENVTAWKVSQAALMTVKAESWESLGCQMQQVPSLNRLLVTEGKINAFIHCFVAVRRILSLYDLEVAICENEGIERFEELELGPLVRHPLIVHYFGVNSDVTEVYKISSEEIICYLSELLATRPKKEVEVDTLLDFISKKQSVSRSQKLCVRIQNIGMYMYQLKKAKQSEHAVLKGGSEQTRKRALQRRKKRPLFSAQKEHLDEHFSAISQRIKSFSSENSEFCGKHVRFEPSSSEDDDSVDNEYKDDQVENSAGSNCSLPLSKVKSDHVSRCPYPSANEERTRLGLKSDSDCNVYTADGGVRCDAENEQSKRKRRSENESFTTSPRKYPKMDKDCKHKDLNGHSLTNEALKMFVTTWKDACRSSNADEVLERMLQFYNCRSTNKVKALFTSYPFIGLLNAAVSYINSGMWDNMYDTFQGIDHQSMDSKNSDSSADYISIDVKPPKDGIKNSALKHKHKHDVTAEDIAKKISGYFEDDILNVKNPSQENIFSFLRKLCKCQYSLIEGYAINEFESLGYGEYFLFIEKYMHLLPRELQKCLMGVIYENATLEARLLPLQLDVLLSQAFGSLQENETVNMQTISELLARQFPLVCFKLLKCEFTQNFLEVLREKSCTMTSNSVLFSTPLFRLNCLDDSLAQNTKKIEEHSVSDNYSGPREGMIGVVTTKDAVEVLLKAPVLTDLKFWSHWDLLFAPSLGSLVEWLVNEVSHKELMCLVTNDGKIIRVDHSATLDSFLNVLVQGSAFEIAVELLSLYALYGGERNVPLSLLKCHARQAFEVMISNSLDKESHDDNNPLLHGKLSCDQQMVTKNTSFDSGSRLLDNRIILDETVAIMSRFILDCLSYLPIEFCSFAADVLIAGLQSFVKSVPLAILAECKEIKHRLILHEVGFSLGLVEWVNDYHSFHSSLATGIFPGSSCLAVASLSNTKSMVQDLPNKTPPCAGEMSVSHEAGCHNVNSNRASGGADSAEVLDDGAAAASEQFSVLKVDEDPVRIIKSIREEEFGLDQSLSGADNKMLEKQHARLGRALHCLSQELYSQDSHFLLELVQNADDNIYLGNVEPTLAFIFQKKGIVVLNNEKGFLANNIRALCDVGNSTKKGHNAGYIGKKGIGFKSVFRVTDAPEIHSNGFHIKFDITEGQIGFVLPTVIPPCDIELYSRLAYAATDGMDQKSWNTCILLPFRPNSSEAFAINNIVSMFSDLHPSLLLFLHRLKCIMFRNLLDDSVIVMRKEVLGDGIIQVAFGNEKMNWFVVSQKLQVVLSQQLQADVNRSDVQKTEISLAFTLEEIDDGGYVPIVKQQPVFAFLPLRTYGLKFILQGDFVLPSSREEVDGNSPWNQWLRSQFPDLFVSAERAFCDLPCYRGNLGKAVTTFMSFIPLVGEVHGFFSCLPQMIISKLRMSNCLILEKDEKEWVPPCKVLRNWTPQARSLLPDSFLHEHLGLGFLNKDIVLSDTLARTLGVEDYGPKFLLRIISILCHSENGLKSMGLNWLSTLLSAIYVMSSHYSVKTSPSFLSESDIILKLQKTPFIPLSDGNFVSVDEDTVWLYSEAVGQGINDEHALKAFPELYAKLRIVSPNLLTAAASTESSCADATVVDSVKRMLYKVGVQRLSAHEIVKAHILPAISDDKIEKKLMTEYLSFVMLHLQSSCTSCCLERDDIIVELREKAVILTNYGYKRSNDVPIHFNREYMNPFDVNRLINGIDMKWHEVDATYLKHPITKSLSDGLLKWRTFFQDIGVTDFVQTVQAEKRIADMSFVNIKDIIWSRDKLAVDSVAKNWESEELFCLLSWISSEGDREKSILLMEILDSLWDVYFSDKLTGYCIDSSGECSKPFKSSLIRILQDAQWIASSFDNQLHYPKDLFHDCLAVNSILGVSAPYTILKVKSEKLLSDIGFKTQVTLNDALSVLELWKRSDSPIKASISQMSNFYGFLWEAMALSKKEILDALHSGPFIFVPHNTSSCSHEDAVTGALLSAQDVYWHDNISQIEPVRPECDVALTTSPLRRMLCSFYPNLHDFFVNDCGVNESPPLHSYLQILLQLCTTTLPHQTAKTVFEVFLKWANALKSGSLSLENIEYLKESLLKKEYTVLPTRQDKWVSLHSSFGLVCWGDDDKLVKEFKHLEGVDFLYFGESTDEENETLHAKVSIFMQTFGIPALSKIVTREAIYYGPQDCSFIFSLVNWVLPYAQRYIYNAHPDKYFELKQSISENLEHLKIVVVDKLFYRNVIKRCELTSKKRHECDCLLQENVLYCIKGSDPHSIFLELSCLLYNRTHELHFANFLHMITTMAESGATEDQTEFFVLNSQKVKKLPAEESCWSLQYASSLPETDSTPLDNYHPEKTEEQNSSVYKRRFGINSNWPPADWKTAPGFDSTNAIGLKKSAPFNSVIIDSNIELSQLTNVGINGEFNLEADQKEIAPGEIFHNTGISEFQYSLSGNLVSSGKNTVVNSVDRVTPVGMSSFLTNFDDTDQSSAQQAKLTGRMGEFVAFKYFLGKVGGEVSVNWVNETNETGLPYDIIIENNEESMEYIEVKATKFTRKNWFLITMREWEFAIEKGESFSIAHVILEDDNMAKVTVYKNPAKLSQLGNLKLAIVVPKE